MYVYVYASVYPAPLTRTGCKKGQVLSGVTLGWIQGFPSPWLNIFYSIAQDMIWHKVFFIVGVLGKGDCWTVMVIGSMGAMWPDDPAGIWTH